MPPLLLLARLHGQVEILRAEDLGQTPDSLGQYVTEFRCGPLLLRSSCSGNDAKARWRADGALLAQYGITLGFQFYISDNDGETWKLIDNSAPLTADS